MPLVWDALPQQKWGYVPCIYKFCASPYYNESRYKLPLTTLTYSLHRMTEYNLRNIISTYTLRRPQ